MNGECGLRKHSSNLLLTRLVFLWTAANHWAWMLILRSLGRAGRAAALVDIVLQEPKEGADFLRFLLEEVVLFAGVLGKVEELHGRQSLLFGDVFSGRRPAAAAVGKLLETICPWFCCRLFLQASLALML